jgi:hypothetical protein
MRRNRRNHPNRGRWKTWWALAAFLALAGCRSESDQTPDAPHNESPDVACGGREAEPLHNEDEESSFFRDVTEQCEIDFVHYNGATGEYLLPEITGSGGALFDYDNDGDLDLYLVQGAELMPDRELPAGARPDKQTLRDRLYRNDLPARGTGPPHFTDVTADSGIVARGYGMGVATGDFDNDGWVDLYVTNVGSNQLLRNNGDGTFSDVTQKSSTDDPRWSTSASMFDYDRDGWLDLFVTNYVDFSIDKHRECFAANSARDYCGPDSYKPVVDRLWRNRGDGTFEDVTATAEVDAAFGAGLGVVTADFDGDGWTDIYVANDGDPNQLWINRQGSGTFQDDALLAGVALNAEGAEEAGMGVDAGDFDGDGDEDLFMTHLERESNTFYVNLGGGRFEDRTIHVGLHASSLPYTAFGTRFFDYDNDGWLDLLVLNGAVRTMKRQADKGDAYPLHQPNQLFQNDGRGKFVEVTQQAGPVFEVSEVSRGAAFGDVDNDGDTDVVVFNNRGRARLLLNQVGNQRHWLGLRLLESGSGRDSYQARVEITRANEKPVWQRVHTDGSYCSASDLRLVIGLGDNTGPCTVRVYWPHGQAEEWRDLVPDRYWVLKRGKGETPSEP